VKAWRALPPEGRQAAAAAAALVVCLFLPWYQATKPEVIQGVAGVVEYSLNAFEVFTFVEAAVMLVAGSVLWLLWSRSQHKAFHLPGGDGWILTVAGGWVVVLLVYRLFDKPDVDGAAVGVQWGVFVTLAVAAALAASGQRMRAAHRPEPPNPIATEDEAWEAPPRRRASDRRRPRADATAVTEVLSERPPTWEGEPPEPLDRIPPGSIPLFDVPATREPEPEPEPEEPEADGPIPGTQRLF
jgi:hypothetical protein